MSLHLSPYPNVAFDFLFSLLGLLFLLSSAVASPPPPVFLPSSHRHGIDRLDSRANNASPPGDLTAPSSNVAIRCDGTQYRTGLKPLSCQDAIVQIPRVGRRLRFVAPEQRGRGIYDVALPLRFISSDGLCTIDLVSKDGVTSDTSSYYDLLRAAVSLEHTCVANKQVGGIALNIGDNAGLGLIMTSAQPRVQCRRAAAPSLGDCRDLENMMMTTQAEKTFGNPSDPNALIKLPMVLQEGNRRCAAVIRTTGPTDISSYYEIWESIVAITGVCVRRGLVGTALSIGKRGYLAVDLRLDSRRQVEGVDQE